MKFSIEQFIAFTEPFEGKVNTLYRDSRDLVTVGYGNLMEPLRLGEGLSWMRGGRPASHQEYVDEWYLVNDAPELGRLGWKAARELKRPGGIAPLYLTDETILNLVKMRLGSNEAFLIEGFPGYDDMCADAQLFLHSMAWACGALFWKVQDRGYFRLRKLINAGKFGMAQTECEINPKVGTIILRNEANKQLLLNAMYVSINSVDPNKLYYPGTTSDVLYDHSVVNIQHALSLLGWNIVQDGIMGPKTIDAIKKFQALHKLKVDGIVGPVTWAELQTRLRFR